MVACMSHRAAHRLASNIRAALVVVAFTAIAAVGYATAQRAESIRPTPSRTVAPAHAPCAHGELLVAPGGAPLSASVFTTRF